MNAELKAEWVAALRSGEFEQGQHALRDINENGNTSYCCLGVLCELFSRKGEGKWFDFIAFHYGPENEEYDHEGYGVLPLALAKRVGLKDGNPILNNQGKNLAALNDSGMSFAEIADLIEAEL